MWSTPHRRRILHDLGLDPLENAVSALVGRPAGDFLLDDSIGDGFGHGKDAELPNGQAVPVIVGEMVAEQGTLDHPGVVPINRHFGACCRLM